MSLRLNKAQGAGFGPPFVLHREPMRPRKGIRKFRQQTKYVHKRSEGLRGKRGVA